MTNRLFYPLVASQLAAGLVPAEYVTLFQDSGIDAQSTTPQPASLSDTGVLFRGRLVAVSITSSSFKSIDVLGQKLVLLGPFQDTNVRIC